MVKILLVEDDVIIQELVNYNLEREGYTVIIA
ncbi:MAG: DNA-binding response regulator, partial [Desulfitobacterium hafniense]